jgi:hypothetical protein
VIGGWRRKIEKNGVTIDMTLLTTLNKSEKAALREAVDHYARFLKKPAVLQVKKKRRSLRPGPVGRIEIPINTGLEFSMRSLLPRP